MPEPPSSSSSRRNSTAFDDKISSIYTSVARFFSSRNSSRRANDIIKMDISSQDTSTDSYDSDSSSLDSSETDGSSIMTAEFLVPSSPLSSPACSPKSCLGESRLDIGLEATKNSVAIIEDPSNFFACSGKAVHLEAMESRVHISPLIEQKACLTQDGEEEDGKDLRKVHFNPKMKIILITCNKEYEEWGLKDHIWYRAVDYILFKNSAKLAYESPFGDSS